MITDNKNSALLDEYQKACEDEIVARIALHDYLSLPATQKEIMSQLSDQMETAHNKLMDTYNKLVAVRIGGTGESQLSPCTVGVT